MCSIFENDEEISLADLDLRAPLEYTATIMPDKTRMFSLRCAPGEYITAITVSVNTFDIACTFKTHDSLKDIICELSAQYWANKEKHSSFDSGYVEIYHQLTPEDGKWTIN